MSSKVSKTILCPHCNGYTKPSHMSYSRICKGCNEIIPLAEAVYLLDTVREMVLGGKRKRYYG